MSYQWIYCCEGGGAGPFVVLGLYLTFLAEDY